MQEAVKRADVDPKSIDDVVWGCAMPEASQGLNMARLAVLRAGSRSTSPRQRSTASARRVCRPSRWRRRQIMSGMADVVIAGGVEMMSQVPMSGYHTRLHPDMTEAYIGMGFTAERVAERWKVSPRGSGRVGARAATQKAARAIESGAFDEQIVPVPVERVTWKGATKQVESGLHRARRARARRHDAWSGSPSSSRRSRWAAP